MNEWWQRVRGRLGSWQAWQERLAALPRWLRAHPPPETTLVLLTALLVGLSTGLVAVGFNWLLRLVTTVAFDGLPAMLASRSPWYLLLLPAVGGLLAGVVITYGAPETRGPGVAEVMIALARHGGYIRPRVILIKMLATVLTVGTGGSAGREGPIVQIGASLGSNTSRLMRLSQRRTRTMAACGAASGVAALFNAPIAGVLFALEVILGDFGLNHLATVVLSAVTASIVGQALLGNNPAFPVPAHELVSAWELPLYALLGVLAGLMSVLYVALLYRVGEWFDGMEVPAIVKPALGGLGVGAIGLIIPGVLGGGYDTIGRALQNEILVGAMALLFVGKLVATALTLGSGGSGGAFAPGLFLGAVLGGEFGVVVHRLFPTVTAAPGAYALVGMAALFAASARAPLSAIMMLFEMTGDYRIILPLMLATVVGTLLAQALEPHSIYTEKLARLGIHLERGRDVDMMRAVRVGEVMSLDFTPIPRDMALDELGPLFARTHHHGFIVQDDEGALFGVVTLSDLNRALALPQPPATVGEIATTTVEVTYPDETMGDALNRMAPLGLSRLPVVERDQPDHVIGLIRRRDIVRAYNIATLRQEEFRQRAALQQIEERPDAAFVQFTVRHDLPVVDQPVRDLNLPDDCVLVSIRRGRTLLIPHGNTRLQAGDRLTALVRRGGEAALRGSLGLAPHAAAQHPAPEEAEDVTDF